MVYKLLSLKREEETEKYIHYTIKVERSNKWYSSKPTVREYNCFQEKMWKSNYFTETGNRIYDTFANLERSINAVLDTNLTDFTL